MARRDKGVWGIDIGQVALKALRCKVDADGETIHADKYDYIEYPKILSQPEADPDELVQEALLKFLSRNEVAGDKVAICVSGQAGLSRFFKPPPVDIKTMPDIVKYEVKQQIPFPIEDVIWDWQQLGGTISEGRAIDAEVGLFAMKRDAVFRALRPYTDVDVEVDFVQLSPLAIFNVICHDMLDELPSPEDFDPESPPPSTVVMSMGTDTTDLIVTNGIKLWLRNIPIGGNHFTRHLSRELKLTQTKAEHLKRNARQSENPKAVFKAMQPVFKDLVNEVQRSLTFFQSMEKNAEISEIVLLGNAAKLPGLRQFLNKKLEIEIAKGGDFKKLTGGEVINQKSFANNVLSFAPCYGLCLQALNKGKIKTNLLPQEIVIERVVRAKKPWVLASVGLLMLGLVLGLYFIGNAWWHVNPEFALEDVSWDKAIKNVATEKSKSDRFLATDGELKIKLGQFNTIADELSSSTDGKASWLEVYSALFQALPRDKKIEEELKAGNTAIDPIKFPFKDREDLYIDHIESVFHKDLGTWFKDVEPIYERMFSISEDDMKAAKMAGASASAMEEEGAESVTDEETSGENPYTGTQGWVIEIQAHHFHNSTEALRNFNSGKSYVLNTFIKNMIEMTDVKIPSGDADDLFSFADLGIQHPTIVRASSGVHEKTIVFDPTAPEDNGDRRNRNLGGRGMGMGMDRGMDDFGPDGFGDGQDELDGEQSEESKTVFPVDEYNFVVQFSWIPRTASERIDARAKRRADEAAKLEAAQTAVEVDATPADE